MIKFLSLVFCQLRWLFKAIYDDGFADFKAMTVIVVLQILLISSVVSLLSIALGRDLIGVLGPTGFAIALGLGILAPNYIYFWDREVWRRFEEEFRTYSLSTRLWAWLAILSVLVFDFFGISVIASAGKLPQ